jgi:hypothetical protein
MKLDLYSTIEIIRANDWGDTCSKQWNLHNRFPPGKNKVYVLPWTRIGTSFLQAFYFYHSFKNYLEKWLQFSHTVSVLWPRSLKMLNTTPRFSYNFKKHILSKLYVVKVWSTHFMHILIWPSIRFPNCVIFYYVLKIKAMPIWAKNIKIIGLLYSSKFNMCTSLIEILHFLFVIVVLPFIFVDDAIICLANYGRLCTSKSEHLYFPLWIHVLLALILLYFPLDDFIMFSSTFMWNMHFQNWTFVLPSTWFVIF